MGIEEIQNRLNKKFKIDGLLQSGDEFPEWDRIPFSSPRLNYLTRGGIPTPGAVEISGPEGSGKTTLLGDLTKNAQAKGLVCAFTDTENKTDLDYWKWLGVDTSQLIVCRPAGVTGEDILELQFDLFREGIRFAGLDSVASLVPKSVLTGDMNDKTYCGSSGIMSTFSQKLTGSGILQLSKACLVGINQVRDKINGFGFQTPAGHFWKHACICRMQINRGNPFDYDYKEMPMGTTEDTFGYTMEAKLLKNQFCRNDRRFNYCTFNYEDGIDIFEDMVEVAISLGVIYKAGSWYSIIQKETGEILAMNGEDLKFQGKAAVRKFLKENTRMARWVEGQVNKYIND